MYETFKTLVTDRKTKRTIETDMIFSCLESITEKTSKRHYITDAQTQEKIKEICEETGVGECELASAIVCSAADAGWKPFKEVKKRKLEFKDTSAGINIATTAEEYKKIEELAEKQFISVGDYIRLALNLRLIQNKDFK